MSKIKTLSLGLGAAFGLGVAMLPMTAFADAAPQATASVDVNVSVATVISMTLDTYSVVAAGGSSGTYVCDSTATPNCSGTTQVAAMEMLPNTADLTTMYTDVYVSTNSSAGFTLTLIDADDNANLTSSSNDTINTIASKPVAGSNAGWAVSVNDTDVWQKMPKAAGTSTPAETAITVESYTPNPAAISTNRKNTVHYGVATSAAQPTGTYTDTVTYTATAN